MTKKTKIILVIVALCIVGSFGLSLYISSLQYNNQEQLGRAWVRQQMQELIATNPFPDRIQFDQIANARGEPNFKDCFVTSGLLSFCLLLTTILNGALLITLLVMLYKTKITVQPTAAASPPLDR
jgi:hypothetical protein